MEAVGYSQFSSVVHQGAAASRLPVNGTIEVTRRCPLTCAHCYNNLAMNDHGARQTELTYDEHCRILDDMTEAGCLWLLYTGGEIFARRDFLDIYTYAKRKGLIITLFTNGTMITPQIADYLAEWPPFAIEITLYGRTKATYEQLTGIPGSYERCLNGIDLLMERHLPLKLKTVGVTINKHEIAAMRRFAEDELGLEFKFDSMINPRIDCSQSPLAMRLSPAEIVGLDLQEPKVIAEWKKFAQRSYGPVNPPEHNDEVYHCGGGITSFAIDPQGRMSICVLSQMEKYDLRRGSFREAWEEFLLKVRRKKITRPTKCISCPIKAMCGMCPANGELENSDPESPVDFLCHTAHLRAHVFGISVTPHGECEYCKGGARYVDLEKSVASVQAATTSTSRLNGDLTFGADPDFFLASLLAEGTTKEQLSEVAPAASAGCSSGGCDSCSFGAGNGR